MQRTWVLRERAQQHPDQPHAESIGAAVAELRRTGVAAAALQQWLNSALILPVSGFIKDELAKAGCQPEKMTVHYNGADASQFKPGEKGKKEEKAEAAKKVASRFSAATPPLKAVR